MLAFGQQRLLDFSGDAQFVLDARLLERLPIQARVFDRDAGLCGQRVERRAGMRREQAALFAAVEIEHADVLGFALHVRAVEIADHAQRNARNVPDAKLHGAEVHVGEIAVEQVSHDLQLAGDEHLFGNLAAGLEPGARQRDAALRTRQFHVEVLAFDLTAGRRQHDEAALGSRDIDRRIEHHGQHLIEHAARPKRAQSFEERRELAKIVDRAGVRSIRMRGAISGQEHHVGAAGPSELDFVAVRQLVLGNRFAVDVGAIARTLVAQDPVAVLIDDLGMLA